MRNWVAALSAGVGLAIGCAPQIAGEPLSAPSTGEAFGGTSCSAVRPPTEPDLMGWDPGSRANLDRLRHEGVVAVRYEAKGCNVELSLLSNCIAKGPAYKYSPYSANDHKIARNAAELFAQLPIGAASLSGQLKGTRALRTDYMLAGTHALPPGTGPEAFKLEGSDCEKATHVVSAIYVGGFVMASGETRDMEAMSSLFGARAGGKSGASMEALRDEGDPEACSAAQKQHRENEGCAVPLRIALLPLNARSAPLPETAHVTAAEGAPPPPPPQPAASQPPTGWGTALPPVRRAVAEDPDPPPPAARTITELQQTMMRAQPSLRRCHQTALKTNPSLAEAKVTATLDIEPDGTVSRVDIKDEVGDPTLSSCVVSVVRALTFGKASAPQRAAFPLAFHK